METVSAIMDRFDASHPVIGMVHLPPLPGAPGFGDGDEDDRAAIRRRALADARRLEAGGVDGIIVENFGDAPFYPDDVPKHVVAEMTATATAVTDAVDVPVGINVLRNDAAAAVSVAAAADAAFVRVNVHVGSAATDQGVLEGRAHETLRLRDRLAADVSILADVHVKHASPIGDRDIERAALEAVERGRADGVIVSGPGTGAETSLADLERVVDALADRTTDGERDRPPVFVGSGVTSDTVGDCLAAGADGVIVGTALKRGGETTSPISRDRVDELVGTVRDAASSDD
ncbi:photosystem I assembly BtpA [Natrinema pellirubrum DSM 15624]|uniref:Membrane complex biogenesis protein, BtpA family n=1 Tax=Natrinema pellirubrum (strain DSM 15624 / CIP 106293 / JCM 10476 / NCIMB 786 / 157) TaxID=797303 RepID=L0JPD3_NATP1|nr:BtpA/SgcQ family protein [Natrinema pellirubrum]AGB32216.1 membrane complex biogenesis protein, BtpA family [Natrinema pellirubrum DSM 15624]ELY74995.1 photosystem I assembly BtpA [Natrinema pellirubrum DSM 15624]